MCDDAQGKHESDFRQHVKVVLESLALQDGLRDEVKLITSLMSAGTLVRQHAPTALHASIHRVYRTAIYVTAYLFSDGRS